MLLKKIHPVSPRVLAESGTALIFQCDNTSRNRIYGRNLEGIAEFTASIAQICCPALELPQLASYLADTGAHRPLIIGIAKKRRLQQIAQGIQFPGTACEIH